MSITTVTDDSFASDVVEADKPVLIDFWAPWCGPCRQIAPALEELATEYADILSITKMDIDENPETPGRFGVRGVPTLIIFKDGEPVATSVGAKSKSDFAAWIEKTLSDAAA